MADLRMDHGIFLNRPVAVHKNMRADFARFGEARRQPPFLEHLFQIAIVIAGQKGDLGLRR